MAETDIMRLMRNRHAVRSFTDEPIAPEAASRLQEEVDAVNEISGLRIQLVLDDPKAFTGFMAKYEGFKGVRSYFALMGPNSDRLDEQCGHFGEHLVLLAQQLGLNTCWSGLGFNRKRAAVDKHAGERLALGIALGHGTHQGAPDRPKTAADISNLSADSPDWFRRGIEAVLLAPTVLDEQGVHIDLMDDTKPDGRAYVRATASEKGHFNYVDYGIAKYHFEMLAGTQNFVWC